MKLKFLTLTSALFLFTSSAVSADSFETYARVISSDQMVERVNKPSENCSIERVTETSTAPAEKGISGAIIGGIAGGLLGHTVGKGNGNAIATGAGAIGGAIIGDRMQNGSGSAQPETKEIKRCVQVDNWESKITGYKVTYEYGGQTFATVLPYNPGSSIKVQVSVSPKP